MGNGIIKAKAFNISKLLEVREAQRKRMCQTPRYRILSTKPVARFKVKV